MRSIVLGFLLSAFLLGAACGQKDRPGSVGQTSQSQEDYVGNWKVSNPQLGTYFMTLNADGSGSSTLTGGELGQWKWKADHIELEWTPKKMTFYFDSGSSQPKDQPSQEAKENSTAEKVEDVPMD